VSDSPRIASSTIGIPPGHRQLNEGVGQARPKAPMDRGELGAEHLERDVAVVAPIARAIDGGHAALADLLEDRVAPREGSVQPLDHVGHRGGAPVVLR
jgi:hypothetical protein